MTYGPYGGADDDLEEWIRQQAVLSDLNEPVGSGLGAYQPPPHAEMPALNFDTGPDWSDALGAGTTALAALADLGLNKGRGTGQILAAGGQFGQARAEQRLRGTQDALNYEERRAQLDKSNRYNDYLYASLGERTRKSGVTEAQGAERIDVSKRNAASKEAAGARAATDQDPSELIAWAKDRGYDLGGLETMTQARSALGPLVKQWELEHADEKAKATRSGTIAADLAAAPDTNAVAADKAAGIAKATQPYKVELAGEGAAAREAATGAGARADENASQGRYNKFRDETEKTRPMVGIAANLDKTLAKYPQDKPGVGMWDSFKSGKLASDDDLAVRGAVGNMTDLVARVRSGAAIPPKEFENIARFVDGGEGATEQQFRVAYSAFKKSLQQEMKEQSRGREKEARDVLGQYGDWALGAPPSPGGATPIRLGPTGPGAPNAVNMPGSEQLPRAQPNPDGTFTLPGGRRPYTAQEVQQFIQMGRLAPL